VVPTGPRPQLVPHHEMTVEAVTSEHTANDGGAMYHARLAIDDRVETAWRSEYQPAQPVPQSITLDLGKPRTVHALLYRPRVTGPAGGAITAYNVYTSSDAQHFQRVASGYWEETLATKVAAWPAHTARYLRLEATDSAGCPKTGVAADLNVALSPMRELGQGAPPADDVPEFAHLVPQAQMTATASSQQPGYEATKAIDANCGTMWHTSWSPYQAPPQTLTLDLGAEYRSSALVYEPRQDGNRNGIVTGYRIEVSTDGQSFTEVAAGSWAADDATKFDTWEATPARYVRLVALSGQGGYLSAAEVNVAHEP
jgi:hypothetical protein